MGACVSTENPSLRCREAPEEAEVVQQHEVLASAQEPNLQELPSRCQAPVEVKSSNGVGGQSPSTLRSGVGELHRRCLQLERRLRPMALSSPSQTLKVFQDFPVKVAEDKAPWGKAMAGCEPILFQVAGFLLGEPEDFRGVMLNKACAVQLRPFLELLWRGMYQRRWPSFYDCLVHHKAEAWCAIYWQTLKGQCDFPLEVFEREKKLGFSMSAMPAEVFYDQHRGAYVATYVSASEVKPESIPISEEHRLRFCPAAPRLDIRQLWSKSTSSTPASPQVPRSLRNGYPYRVLEGLEGLEVGKPVELQWKMQLASPFGWWHCHLEALRLDDSGTSAWATVIFKHFSPRSRWYRLRVHVGQRAVRRCDFGGFTGGLRAVTENEERQWTKFFPRKVLDV